MQMSLFLFLLTWMALRPPSEAQGDAFERIIGGLIGSQAQPIGELTVAVGKKLIGTPYVERTLEMEGPERLVVFFDGFDCVTFVESCLAIAGTLKSPQTDFAVFRRQLQTIRYRNGAIDGYPSRLHYFSDWGGDNAHMGIVADMTQVLGGIPYPKTIDFMSTHREAYAQLSHEGFFEQIKRDEAALNSRRRFYIPKDKVSEVENQIKDGDILAITSTVEGLDVAHTGLALHVNGRLHLLHASSAQKKVAVSVEPLADYLDKHGSQSGIMVFRPL